MNDNIREILDGSIIGSIATVNRDGSPWSTPIHVFSDDDSLYWFSMEDKQHSVNISRDPRVSLTLFSQDTSEGPKGVYVNSEAIKLDNEAAEMAREVVVSRLGKIPSAFEGAAAYKLPMGNLDNDRSNGNCWYFYT